MKSPLTMNMLVTASAGPPGLVDSHALRQRLRLDYPDEFAIDLQRFSACGDPERAHSAAIARRYLGVRTLTKTRKIRSLNVRGNVTSNQEWRR